MNKNKYWQKFALSAFIVSLGLACVIAPNSSFARTKTRAAHNVVAHPRFPADFNGVWQVADATLVIRPDVTGAPYTPQAKQQIDDYKSKFDTIKDDPAKFCSVKGMPWTMLSRARDYPVEVYQTADRVVMFFEFEDKVRNIHLGQTSFPENLPPSAEGYSIAHWEGNTLVVQSQGFSAREYPDPYLRTENAKMTERYTRGTHPTFGDIITIDIIIDDPEIYTTPAHAHQVFKRAPQGTIVGGYGCGDALWREYIEPKANALSEPQN